MADRKDSELAIKGTLVDGDLIPVLDSETAVDADKNKTVAFSTLANTIFSLNVKVIEIGDWNMDTTAAKNVAHGLDYTKIRSVSGIIRNDPDTTYSPIGIVSSDGNELHVYIDNIGSLNVSMERLPSPSIFDTINYDSTSFNRGWLTILYAS